MDGKDVRCEEALPVSMPQEHTAAAKERENGEGVRASAGNGAKARASIGPPWATQQLLWEMAQWICRAMATALV